MKRWRKLMIISLLFAASVPPSMQPQETFRAKELLQKDLHAYAGGELVLSVGEITIAPGASGSRHRHPGPTFVYVLEGAVEIELGERQHKCIARGRRFMKTRSNFTFQQKTGARRNPLAFSSTTLATKANH